MDQVGQIREKIDLVSFIQEFIPLKKAGANFKANCPFHNEKTPSFVVSPERQIWHCFGCSRGGDCYTFLMEYEHIEFIEALRELAKRTGVELEQFRFSTQTSSQKDKIYSVNKIASEFYHFVLTKHPAGKFALSYLGKRGVTAALINTFKLGFSPPSSTALTKYLREKKNYKKEDIVLAGLGIEKQGRLVDFFFNRIMFPLYDHRGNIIGFSGRVLTENNPAGSKYINTRETLVYHKGDVFYGLNSAKETIKKTGQAIVVEGEFDVISCYKNGITNAIAVKGTAFTDSQAHLLSRFAQRVTLCFDKDSAGQDALKRSIPNLEKYGFTITVCEIPGGKDPDESFQNDPYAFKNALKEDSNVYDYLLSSLILKFDKTTAEGKKKITTELLPLYSCIQNEIVKEHYFKKLSTELDTTYESLQKELEKRKQPITTVQKTQLTKRSREDILEEYLIALILQSKLEKQLTEITGTVLQDSMEQNTAYQKIFQHLVSYCKQVEKFDSFEFALMLPKELLDAYNKCFILPLPPLLEGSSKLKEAEKVAKELKGIYLRSQIKLQLSHLASKLQKL